MASRTRGRPPDSWDADGDLHQVDTESATYDAMGRVVEFSGSSTTEIIYGPAGGKLALMNGQTLVKAMVPLAGGAEAVYNASGLAYYRHTDWVGSVRLTSLPTGSNRLLGDGAYSPYGESYAETGTADHKFAGMEQNLVSSGAYPLYDALMREYNPTWGRWLTPDPAGMAAADPMNPQSWNRYAYVNNSPLTSVDPEGLLAPAPPVDYEDGGCSWEYNPVSGATYLMGCGSGGGGGSSAPGSVPGSSGGGGGGGTQSAANAQKMPCKDLTLDDPSTFWDKNFATPTQLNAFFGAQANAPDRWNGAYAAQEFIAHGINPGVAAGIVGAETSFGGGPPLSARNTSNPFSCDASSGFDASARCAANTVAHDEAITLTPNTPLSALENGQNPLGRVYSETQKVHWVVNVNNWFRKLAKFLGKCS